MRRPKPLRPDRIRTVERPFGWIPFRILTSGILAQLSPMAKLLYFFLCLVADEKGISYYGDRRLTSVLKLPEPALALARAELCRRDLLAFDGRTYQLLSLPSCVQMDVPVSRRRAKGPQTVGSVLEALGWGD